MKSKDKNRKYYEQRRTELSKARDEDWKDLHIEEYAGAKYYPALEASDLLYDLISGDAPFYVCRIGETELRTLNLLKNEFYRLNSLRIATYHICVNAGFFPRSLKEINRFCDLYLQSMMDADYLGMMLWENEEFFMSQSSNLKGCFQSRVLDPLRLEPNRWLQALSGKKVLVVSPFVDSIKSQYERRDLIFSKDSLILGDFDLKNVKAVQSIGGHGAEGFSTWFDALEYLKKQVDEEDYDIALLGCGSYGMPLSSYIKRRGKKAIYMGGSLQLLFGILGKRWETEEYAKKFFNEYWVRPGEEECPTGLESVEGGCYW
ncbi:MAG: hypothetical protein K5888_07720 [Lachnospiraceae bacterium]|nr:hypothetical protein [Lachnospiraceae bacterium]